MDRDSLPESYKLFFKDGFIPLLQEKAFGVEAIEDLPDFILKFAQGEGFVADPESFSQRLGKAFPNFEIVLWASEDLSKAYLSEVLAEERFAGRETMFEEDELEILRFSLRLPQEPQGPFMSLEDFKKILKKCEPGEYGALDAHDIQTIRRGAVFYFDELFIRNDEDAGEDNDELLGNLYEFRSHFADKEFNDTVYLDSKMTRALLETIWFLQKLGLSQEEVSEFRKLAMKICDIYTDKNRVHPAKHQNNEGEAEMASFFEHFLAVVRLSLGAVQSLEKNCVFTKNDFLESLRDRPNFIAEVQYTALLHDVIEDGARTEDEVRKMLSGAGLEKTLIDQILENLNILNSKRTGTDGEQISIEEYAAGIENSDNPVLKIVKASDITHNGKSFRRSSKFEEENPREIKDSWWKKQRVYEPIMAEFFSIPSHKRAKEWIEVLNANCEFIQLDAWKKGLIMRKDTLAIVGGLRDYPQQKVNSVIEA